MIRNKKDLLSEIETYTSFEEFKKEVGFLDIETTGLSPTYDDITIAGIYSNQIPKIYIKNKNINNIKEDIEKHKFIVTFNGDNFDLKFIKNKIGFDKNFKSIDLMYLLWELGYKGGLKKVEKDIGILRTDTQTSGADAINLWRKYEYENCEYSLKKLIHYNIEDIVNLEILLNYIYYKNLDYPISNNTVISWQKDIFEKLKKDIYIREL